MKPLVEYFPDSTPVAFVADARAFAEKYQDLETWWAQAPQADWMTWFAASLGVPANLLVTAAAAAVRSSLKYLPDRADLPRRAVEAAELWARGHGKAVDCAALSDQVLAECDYNKDFDDTSRVAAAMTAAGAAEALASAAGRSELPNFPTLVTRAIGRAAAAERHAHGAAAMKTMLQSSAETVRKMLAVSELLRFAQ